MFLFFLFWQAGKTAKFNNKTKNNANCSSSLIHWRGKRATAEAWGRGFCLFSFHLPFCQFGVWRAVTLYYLKKQKMQN